MTLRRTELKRTGPPERRTRLSRTGHISPQSDRRRKRDKGYPAQRDRRRREAAGQCEARVAIDCRGWGSEAHHVAGRVGPDPHDWRGLRWVCAPCHRTIHDQPAMAYSLGLMQRRNGRVA